MPHLVDEEQEDEADGKRPAEGQGVCRDRDEHRPERRYGFELDQSQEQRLSLADQVDERHEARAELLESRAIALLIQLLGRRRLSYEVRLRRHVGVSTDHFSLLFTQLHSWTIGLSAQTGWTPTRSWPFFIRAADSPLGRDLR